MAYITALVTFIDVLGFRELIKNDTTGDRVANVVSMLRMIGISDPFGQRAISGATAIQFSDSVVRCSPLLSDGDDTFVRGVILKELEDLTIIQGMLACQFILLRGGITIGAVTVNECGVFGPAFIEAYTLENSHALYPRIILHPNLANTYSKQGKDGWGIYATDGLLLTRNSDDGFQFIDYLKNFPREVHNYPSNVIEKIMPVYLKLCKESIHQEIEKLDVLSSVRSKYIWLAGYHDKVARELLGGKASDLLIDLK